jgi:hypothetical protein
MTDNGTPDGEGSLIAGTGSGVDMDALDKLVQARRRLKDAKEEEAAASAEVTRLIGIVHPQFIEAGVTSMKVNGVTVYLHSQGYAGIAPNEPGATVDNRALAVQMLEEHGYRDRVAVNSQSLSSLLREHGAIANDPASTRAACEALGLDPDLFTFTGKPDLRAKGL